MTASGWHESRLLSVQVDAADFEIAWDQGSRLSADKAVSIALEELDALG